MIITFILINALLLNANPIEITTPISTTYSYDSTHNLAYKGKDTKWSCTQIDAETRTNKAMTFQFTVSEKQEIEVSTCYELTSFASRIIISKSYENDLVSECIDSINADPNGQCDGYFSKLTFTAEKNVKYYATVMGMTDDDKGQFRLTIRSIVNPTNYYCNVPMEITSFPKSVSVEITSDMTPTGTVHGMKRGFWFSFEATQNMHVIDTCNKNTQFATSIYLFKTITTEFLCMSDMPIIEAIDGCGNKARLYYDKFEVGQTYYAFVFFTEDTMSEPVNGNIEITFRIDGGDNYVCQNAYSITNKPYNAIVDMRGYTSFSSPCHLNKYEIGMFYSVRGDGKRYVFHTCFTGSTGDDKTHVELLSGDCGSCLKESGIACGNDEMITIDMKDGELYKFRVVTTNPSNKVKVGLMQIDTNDNSVCQNARIMNMTDLGDQYTQYLIGSNQQKPTEFNCNDGKKDLLGGWYKYSAKNEEITIMHGVYSFKPEEFKGYIAILDSCKSCLSSVNDFFIAEDLIIPSGQTRFVFATTIREGGVGNQFGTFMYWAVRSSNKGGSYSNAYSVNVPYTGIFAIGEHQLQIECDHSIPNLRTFPAIAIKYNQPENTEYTISTCGSETVVSTMIEIVTETSTEGIHDCYSTNDINDCGNGNTITTSEKNTYYALIGINPYVSETKSVVRFNIYEDKEDETSKCSKAQRIESIPSNYYSYTSKSSPSTTHCGTVVDGLKGKWFVYTPHKSISLSIMTDDVSTFNTQIGVYTSCEVISNESVPGECVKGASSHEIPVGQHGTHVIVDLEKDKTYYIFVGGATHSDNGIMRVKFDYHYNDDDKNENDDLTAGQIFGIVIACLILIVMIVSLSMFVGYIIYKKVHATESQFNTF